MRAVHLLLACALAAISVGGCGGKESSHRASTSEPLVVVAPRLVERALKPIHEEFLKDHPGVSIDLRLGLVDELTDRVEKGGLGGDIYVMMNGPEMRIAEKAGAVDAARRTIWSACPITIAAAEGNPKGIFGIQDAARADIAAIAIPNPDRDTTGLAFLDALQAVGLWDRVARKVTYATSPHTACREVEQGKADLAVTYAPCVLSGHSESTLCAASFLPEEGSQRAELAAVPFSGATHPLVDQYLKYLLQSESQEIVGRVGFQPARPVNLAKAKVSLHVPCGAGLQPAMDEIGRIYFDRTGVRVDFAYAGAGMLLSTLMTTRRGDLYIPGEAFYVDQAKKRGFIAEDRPVCYMTPVIGVRKGNPKRITGIADLTRPGLRVAIGDPQAIAIGPMTERILERAGIFDVVQRNVHMKAACVPELANALATHSADVGVIWDVMVFQNRKHLESVPIDPKYNEVSEVLVSRLTCSKQPEEARKLMAFIACEEAAAVFHKHGFATERPEGIRLAPRARVKSK